MPFPKKWENLPAETTPLSAEALKDLEERTSPGINAVGNFSGIDPTGATDSTAGLLKAIEECWEKQRKLIVPFGTYKIGGSGTGVDLSTLPWPKRNKWEVEPWKKQGTERIIGFSMDAAEATFVASSALGKNPCFNIAPPTGPVFLWEIDVRLGHVELAGAKECIGVRYRSISNSKLIVFGSNGEHTGAEGGGIVIDQRGAKVYFGNNDCYFYGASNTLGHGILTESDTLKESEANAAPSAEISGNVFNVWVAGGNAGWGIVSDGSKERQSHANTWRVQAPEGNTAGGILDGGGILGSLWYIGIGNANSSNIDYELVTGAEAGGAHQPLIVGLCEGEIRLNGQKANVINPYRNEATLNTLLVQSTLTAGNLINVATYTRKPTEAEELPTGETKELAIPSSVLWLTEAAGATIGGTSAGLVESGQRLAIGNNGTNLLTLLHEGGGPKGRRFIHPSKANIVIAQGQWVEYELNLDIGGAGFGGWHLIGANFPLPTTVPTVTKTKEVVSLGGLGVVRSRQQVLYAKAAQATTKVKHELGSRSILSVKAWKLSAGEASTELEITSFTVNSANELTITWKSVLGENEEVLIGVSVF